MGPQKYYTVGVSNKFAAFGPDSDASSDDGEIILSAPPLVTPEQHAQPPQATVASRKKEQLLQSQTSPHRERPDRQPRITRVAYGGDGRGALRVTRSRISVAEGSEGFGQHNQDGSHRRRGGRGRRGGLATREYDRRSGPGVRRQPKKAGGGSHNWGQEVNPENSVENQQQESPKEISQLVEIAEDRAPPGDGDGATAACPEIQREEPSIDLDTYRKLQAEKRLNLPTFVLGGGAMKAIETDRELAAQGYVRLERVVGVDAESSHEDGVDAKDRPKKKSVNLFEYVHNEGGRLALFPRRGGPVGRTARGRYNDEHRRSKVGVKSGGVPSATTHRGRDNAPDLKDTNVFPTLGR